VGLSPCSAPTVNINSWQSLREQTDRLDELLPQGFKDSLVSKESIQTEKKQARKVQKMDDGIEAQKQVLDIPATKWNALLLQCRSKGLLSQKETDIVNVATKIPSKIPTEKQCLVLVEVLERVKSEGIVV
jgi:DNA polymerase III delta subunit